MPIWVWLPALLRRLLRRTPPVYVVDPEELARAVAAHPEGGFMPTRKVTR